MKITVLMGAFLPVPPTKGGAVEKIWDQLATELHVLGHDVHLISARVAHYGPSLKTQYRHTEVAGASRSGSRVYDIWNDLVYTLRALPRIEPSDVIITNTFFAPFLINRRRSGIVVAHVARRPQIQFKFYPIDTHYQTVSKAIEGELAGMNPKLVGRIHTIPNPIPSLDVFLGAGNSTKRSVVLYVGRIHPEKGLDILVEAFARLPKSMPYSEYVLRLVGPTNLSEGGGGEAYAESLLERAKSAGVSLELAPPIYDVNVLAQIYGSSSIFVYPTLPSAGESFGIAPLEAMASGAAVILSDLDCFKEYAAPGFNCSTFGAGATSDEQLASCMAEMIWEPVERLRVAKEGRVTAEAFSIARVTGEFVEYFSSLKRSQDNSPR